MIANGSHEPEGAQQASWLIRTRTLTAIAMAAAPIGVLWIGAMSSETLAREVIAALVAATVLALAGVYHIRRVILDLARREERATRDAGHDLLSGLANRKLFGEWINYELARCRRENASFAVMYLDIDHFKDINDRHGHDAGDRMIIALAQRLTQTLRPTDRLARFGGDEFAILQTGVRTMRDAEALATRILDAIRQTFHLGTLDIPSSISIGIALYPDNAASRADLMKLADLALYRAKKEGRNRMAFFDAKMGETLERRRVFSLELANAIETHALTLDYQPVFAAGSQKIIGAEARLRWRHPVRGWVEPGEIVSIAEERGLVLQLGEWMLREACAAALACPRLRVSVEIASVQFKHRGFAGQVLQILQEAGLEANRLDLCIGEACVLQPKDHAMTGMLLLRDAGVRFTLAHYGDGVASLNYIRQFPFSRIKLHRSCLDFAPGIMNADAAVLHAVIHLGRALGLAMAADGIEAPEQARYLTALGCNEVQGALLCPFVTTADLQRMILAQDETAPSAV